MKSIAVFTLASLTAIAAAAPEPRPEEMGDMDEGGRMSILPFPFPPRAPSQHTEEFPSTLHLDKRDPHIVLPTMTKTTIYTVPGVWNEHATSKIDWPPRNAARQFTVPGIWNEHATHKVPWPPTWPSRGPKEARDGGLATETAPDKTTATETSTDVAGATSYISSAPTPPPTTFSSAVRVTAAAVDVQDPAAITTTTTTTPIPGIWNEDATSYISWPPAASPTDGYVGGGGAMRAEQVQPADDGKPSSAETNVGAIFLYICAVVLVLVIGWGVVWNFWLKPRRKRLERERETRTEGRSWAV